MRGLIYFGILEYSNMLMDVGLLAYANMLIGAGGLARYMHVLRILTWINKKHARGVALLGGLAILTIREKRNPEPQRPTRYLGHNMGTLGYTVAKDGTDTKVMYERSVCKVTKRCTI